MNEITAQQTETGNLLQQPSEDQRPTCQNLWLVLRHNAHFKCLVLTSLIVGSLGAISWCRVTDATRRSSLCEDGYIYIPVAFVVTLYLLYLVECWHCSTRIALKRPRTDVASVYRSVQQMWQAQPLIWWKAICYHYVRRSRQVTRYRNGSAYTSTQVFYERIDSHSAGATFVYSHCGVRDISKRLAGLEVHPAVRVRLSKGFAFANVEAAADFEEQRSRFFQEHEHRDDYMEMREGLELPNVNFRESVVAFGDYMPWYLTLPAFWVASCLLASWPFRMLVETRTAHVHHRITKLFGINYHASRELEEWCISHNVQPAPSYSEALLMVSEESPGEDIRRPPPLRHHRHSWALVGSSLTLPVPGLRPPFAGWSLYNGHVLFHPSALRGDLPRSLPAKAPAPGSSFAVTAATASPPEYDVAIRVSWPVGDQRPIIRRSYTDREIWQRTAGDFLSNDETPL